MKVYSVIIMILLLFLASFLMGYNFAARNYELKIAHLEQQAKDYENKVLTSTLETERKNQELVVQLKIKAYQSTRLMMILSVTLMSLTLIACQTVAVPTKCHCPQLPPLPTTYQPVNVDTLQQATENLKQLNNAN